VALAGLWSEWGLLFELGLLVLNYSHQYHGFLYRSQMRGEAEAFAIGARARAEAEQMAKKAEAFQLYQEAAQLDMLLEKLPQVAEEISGPLTSANKITLVSSGGGTMGAAKVTGEVLDILSRLPESVERLTGVSISQVNHKPLRTA